MKRIHLTFTLRIALGLLLFSGHLVTSEDIVSDVITGDPSNVSTKSPVVPLSDNSTLSEASTTPQVTSTISLPSSEPTENITISNTPSSTLVVTSSSTWSVSGHTVTTTPGVTTQVPSCPCELGKPCNISCGEVHLPDPDQDSKTSEVLAENDTYYVEARLDARMLEPSETLTLSSLEYNTSLSVGLPSAIVTCSSNMANDEFVYKAWTGRLQITLSNDPMRPHQCKNSTAISPRIIDVTSQPIPTGGAPKEGEIKFPEDGQLPPVEGTEQAWKVDVTPGGGGFGINVSVLDVHLNAAYGDALYINPGTQLDIKHSVLLSWTTDSKTKPRELRFLDRDSFYLYLQIGPRPDGTDMTGLGFRLTYSNTEPVTPAPTTVSPTTPLPTPPVNVSDSVEEFVGGPSTEDFLLRIEEFQESVANMANQFCEIENIEVQKPVEPQHVLIYSVSRCPFSWPDAANCSAVVYSVPVFTVNVTIYELTSANLDRMWNTLAEDNLPVGMMVYTEPGSNFWWWIGVMFGILFLVILLIILVWRVDVYQSMARLKRNESLLGSNSSRTGSYSAGVNGRGEIFPPHQVVPPYLMELDHEGRKSNTGYTDWGYEPRDSVTRGMVNSAFQDDDDEIDIFTSQHLHRIPDEFGSESDDEIVEAVGPPRAAVNMRDLIYDTPSETDSVRQVRHITLEDAADPNSETVL